MPPVRPAWPLYLVISLARMMSCAFVVVPLTLIILGALAVGESFPAPPTYLETTNCSQPCWQGLQPGRSTREDVTQFVEHNPLVDRAIEPTVADFSSSTHISWETRFFPSYDARAIFYDDLLVSLDLFSDGGLILADVLTVFGMPSHAALCPRFGAAVNYREAVFATLYFYDGAIQVWAYTANSDVWQVRPDMQIQQITYRTAPVDAETWIPLGTATWHGFGQAEYSRVCR